MYRYRTCGLTLASCAELPGAAAAADAGAAADAMVRYGAVPKVLDDTTYRGPNWEVAARQVLLRAPGLAQFLIDDGREVLLEPGAGRSPSEWTPLLTGPVLGVLLHQRGCFVLHASAVAVGEEAVVFCGPSGAGKSVLAAALSAAGYPLLADEICAVTLDGDRPAVVSDGRRLKLWADTIARLGWEDRKGTAVRPGFEKYWVAPAASAGPVRLPLRAVYFLHRQQPTDTSGLDPISFLDFVASLRSHAYRRRLIRALGREQAWLDGCASLARRAAAWRLTRRLDFDLLAETVHLLERHWGR